MGKVASGITEKERKFVDAFMGEAKGNATLAARLAGYSSKTAQGLARLASELLRKPDISSHIKACQKQDPLVATRLERQKFWSDLMFAREGFEDASYSDRMRASELLGKTQADFIERSAAINIDLASLSDEQLSRLADGEDPYAVVAGAKSSR